MTDDIQIQDIPIAEERPRKKRKPSPKPKKRVEDDVPPEISERKRRNRQLVRVSYLFVCMFLSLAGYLMYFNIQKREDINSNAKNTKQESKEDQIIRGAIFPPTGKSLPEQM